MILKEYVSSVLKKPVMTEALKAHILNFYEDLDMPLGELYEVVDAIRAGELQEVSEKMDGQNMTFTVMNGQLQLFSKGASWNRVQKGGVTRDVIQTKYADKPTVREAYTESLDAIQTVIDADPENAERLFQGGQVVVESSIQMPGNPNTIVYDDPSIQFIQAVALGPDVEQVDQEAYKRFISTAQRVSAEGHEVEMGLVPFLKLKRSLGNDDALANKIKSQLDALLSQTEMSPSNTVGDMAVHLVRKQLEFLGSVPDSLLDKAAQRIGTGQKKLLSKKEYVSLSSPQAWADFQALEKRRSDIVGEALVPLEQIIQLMGVYAFRNIEFAIAANTHESGEDLRQWVRSVKDAFNQGNVIADPKTTEKIRVALQRIGDQEEYFEKAVEGIVFVWKGKTRKLTGLFTPINRLRGFFAYGATPAQIRTSEALIREGGNAFKDAEGNPITVSIERDRVRSTLDHFSRNVLEPCGVSKYGMIGSTGKKARSGDLDIAVPVPEAYEKKQFKSELLRKIQEIMGTKHAKAVGQNLAVAYPIIGTPDQLVQIDIMLTGNLTGATWLMKGHGDERVKGVYRNLLLAYVARLLSGELSEETGEKVKATISFPGGLMIKKGKQVIMARTSDPEMILSVLGIDATPAQTGSFEELVDVLRRTPRWAPHLPGFEEYIGHMFRSDPDNAQRAVDYIKGSSPTSENVLRDFILATIRG